MHRRTFLGGAAGAAVLWAGESAARRPAETSASPDWERTYEDDFGYLTDVTPASDGYDVAGWRAENTRRRTVVGSFDPTGAVTDAQLVSVFVPGKPWARADAGDVPVVAGEVYERDVGNFAWIGAVGADGYRWETRVSTTEESGFNALVRSGEGFLAAGWTGDSLFEGDGLIAKVGPDGEIRWTETYSGRIWAIEPFEDGFAVAGTVGPDDESAWLAAVDTDGAVRWERTLVGGSKAYDLAVLYDGGLAVCGKSRPLAWLAAVDADGSLRWEREYGDDGGDRFEVIQVVDDGFALAGITMSYVTGGSPRQGWLVATDSTGAITGDAAVGDGDNHEVFDVAVREDGAVALVGAYNPQRAPNWKGWAVGWNALPTERSASGGEASDDGSGENGGSDTDDGSDGGTDDDSDGGTDDDGESDAGDQERDGAANESEAPADERAGNDDGLPGLGVGTGLVGVAGGAAAARRARRKREE